MSLRSAIDVVVKMSNGKLWRRQMSDVRCENINCQMSIVKYFTSNVTIWKCHMWDAAWLLISVGRHIRRAMKCQRWQRWSTTRQMSKFENVIFVVILTDKPIVTMGDYFETICCGLNVTSTSDIGWPWNKSLKVKKIVTSISRYLRWMNTCRLENWCGSKKWPVAHAKCQNIKYQMWNTLVKCQNIECSRRSKLQ